VFDLPFFATFASRLSIHPIYIISSCSVPDSGPSWDILDPADIANALVANFILQNIASDALNLYGDLLLLLLLLLHFLIEPVFYPVCL